MDKYKYGNKRYLMYTSIFYFLSAALSSFNFYMISDITNAAQKNDMDLLFRCAKILMVVVVLSFIVNYFKTIFEKQYIERSMVELRSGYAERLFGLNVQNFGEKKSDEFLSNLTNDMNRYENGRYRNILEILKAVFIVFTSMILLAMVSFYLFFAGIILFAFSLYSSSKTSEPLKKQEQVKSKSLTHYTNYIKETLLGFYIIKQNKLEDVKTEQFIDHAETIAMDNFNLERKGSHVEAINNTLQTLLIVTILIVGMFVTKKLSIPLGTILLVGTSFMEAMWPMQRIMPLISSLTSMESLLEDFEKALTPQEDNGHLDLDSIETIKFEDAALGYNSIVLDNVDIEINKNDKVLLVGGSGEGKSTILKSLRRQLNPMRGSISVNNINIQNINADSYYRKFSIVDQIGFIFNGSLKNNITLYQDASTNELKEILKLIGLEELDLDYELSNNGGNISGGQRARLLLARSLFLDSEIIVGDEIFASLNSKVGSSIENAMLHLDQTIINVSHIIYEENFELYNKVYLVQGGEVSRINSYQELHDLNILLF